MTELSTSPVGPALTSFDGLTATAQGLFWVEGRPERDGRGCLVRWTPRFGVEAVTGEGADVGTGLHAYGGGAYAVGSGTVWYVDMADSQVRKLGDHRPVTSPRFVYGDLHLAGSQLLAVREHGDGDDLVAVEADAEHVLLRSAGFLGGAVAHRGRLAWTEWPTDQMPWDSCVVWVADYDGVTLSSPKWVAGGGQESAVQPRWGPDGALYLMTDRSGWWNLYRYDGVDVVPVAPIDAECAAAPWELGYQSYGFLDDGRVVMIAQRGPIHRLVVAGRTGEVAEIDLPYTSIKPYLGVAGSTVAVIGSSPRCIPEIARARLGAGAGIEVLAVDRHAEGDRPMLPEIIEVPTTAGPVTAILYRPETGDSAGLIVRVHPGPTYNSELRLDRTVRYYTDHGFAVVDIDYRGSTGYGRAFRSALNGQWGFIDVADCTSVAEHLVKTGLARPGAVFISGASAGGFTALRAAVRSGPFAAATARSAIVDPHRWATSAPRFQRAHARTLAHPHSGVDPAAIGIPVLLVHGTDDPITPAADVVALAEALRARQAPAELLILDGVGHSISGPQVLDRVLRAELALYRRVLVGGH